MNFEGYVEERQSRINSFLAKILPNKYLNPMHLHQAMHYTVLNGGKRVRPLLVYAAGEAFGMDIASLDYPASAVELVHAYSLVHDDLPAMDNDDLRRGKPTCHKAFGEATAILAGDALQTLAFETLTDQQKIAPEIRISMIKCLAQASGSRGMAGGQAMDLKATGQKLNHDQLKVIHQLKTGALISASVQLGALAAGIEEKYILDALHIFSYNIGLCFQIKDDILNCEGTPMLLGKNVGTDLAQQKATFSTVQGVDKAKESLSFFYHESIKALEPLGEKVESLRQLATFIISRDH